MTHACCPSCRLRFSPAASAYITACPQCGEPPEHISSLAHAVGFRLVTSEDLPIDLLPQAVAVAILPDGGPRNPGEQLS